MATFDDAFSAAQQQLTGSGMLVDGQLLNLAQGDKTVAKQVRDALIECGLAEDRFGVALALASKQAAQNPSRHRIARGVLADPSDEIVFAAAEDESSATNTDWWLMSHGVTTGPFDFPTLRQKRGRGEITGSDLVRHTERGTWQRPEEITGLADVSDLTPPREPTLPPPIATQPPIQKPPRIADPIFVLPTPVIDRDTSVDKLRRTDKEFPAVQRPAQSMAEVPDDQTEYFLWEAGRAVGAISREELEARLKGGRLTADDFVQVGRDGDWQPVSSALSGQRPALGPQFGAGSHRDAVVDNTLAMTMAAKSSSSHVIGRVSERTSRRVKTDPFGKVPSTGSHKDSTTTAISDLKEKSSTKLGRSSIATMFDRASELVGGRGRLWTIITVLTVGIVVTIWWQQPLSAGSLYAALDDCHQILTDAGRQQIRGKESSRELARAEIRVRSIRDGLKRRASSQRPALQELFWACDYGLLPLIKENGVAPEYERAYALHMSRALQLIEPGKGQKLRDSATTGQSGDSAAATFPAN